MKDIEMPRYNERSQWNAANNGPTALYRLYDADDHLLYLGITNNPEKRWKWHAMDKPWWHWVVRREVVWLDSRREALAVEEEATREEKPRFGDTKRLGKGWHTHARSEDDPGIVREVRRITDLLRQQITSGTYAVGERLLRSRLAKQYSVSRALMGLVLSRLQADGLVGAVDQRAVTVSASSG